MNQREVVERARGGDHDAFAALVDSALARLDAAARLILRDPELARDAVQEAFIRAWRDLPGLRDPDRFDAWLHRITIDRPAGSDLAGDVADRDLVDRALRGLKPGHRAVVVLHYYLGMPLSDVAAAIGSRWERRSPASTTRSRRCG